MRVNDLCAYVLSRVTAKVRTGWCKPWTLDWTMDWTGLRFGL